MRSRGPTYRHKGKRFNTTNETALYVAPGALSDVPAEQHRGGHRDEARGQDEEDAGLDALERPVAVGGLVGEELAEVTQRLRARRRRSKGTAGGRVAGGRQVTGRDAVDGGLVGEVRSDRLAVRPDDARGKLPVGAGRREATGRLVEHGDRA